MMSMFNNLRMPAKIGLITAVLGAVMIALVSYISARMSSLDAAYSDIVRRIDRTTTPRARRRRSRVTPDCRNSSETLLSSTPWLDENLRRERLNSTPASDRAAAS